MVLKSISEQPIELLDYIFSCVHRPGDLLALAMTSKLFCTIIVPKHIQFRHLRCDIRRKSLWNSLTARPALISQLCTLDLVAETEEPGYPRSSCPIIVPASVINLNVEPDVPEQWISRRAVSHHPTAVAFEEECILALAAVIPYMRNLTRFCWNSHGSQFTRQPKIVFSALKECPNLEELHIEACQGWDIKFELDTASTPLWELENLSRISVSIMHSEGVKFGSTPFKYPPLMMDMLINRCPALRDLHIHYQGRTPLRISRLFEQGHWPQLIRLSTTGDVLFYEDAFLEENIIESFLQKHPHLECLHLEAHDIDSQPVRLPPNSMPHLRSISMSFSNICKTIPVDAIPHLEYIAGINLDYDETRASTLHLLAKMPALRCISISCSDAETLKRLVHAVPHLERIRFFHTHPWSLSEDPVANSPSAESFKALAGLERLTHIGGFITINSTGSRSTWLEPALAHLAAARNLRYVELDLDAPFERSWITLERDENAAYSGRHFTEDLRDVRFSDWGDIFMGIAELGRTQNI